MHLLLSLLLTFSALTASTPSEGGKKTKTKMVTIEGSYDSVRGVMKPLSCYCYDAGYVTTANGDEIAVCFEKSELEKAINASEDLRCERIRVTGAYVVKTVAPDNMNPCAAGTMRVLKVSKFQCLQ